MYELLVLAIAVLVLWLIDVMPIDDRRKQIGNSLVVTVAALIMIVWILSALGFAR